MSSEVLVSALHLLSGVPGPAKHSHCPFMFPGFCSRIAPGGAGPGKGAGKVQPSWADAPSLEISTLLIPGTAALGLRESSLWASGLQEGGLLLTTLTTPTQFLLLQLHSALHDPQSRRNSWGTAQMLISGRKFAQCFGCCLEPSLPWVTAVCTKLEQTAFAGDAEAQPARKCFLGYSWDNYSENDAGVDNVCNRM